VPTGDICTAAKSLFDHLVGAGEQCGLHVKAERLRGFEVDYQLVFRRRLYWQIGRLLAFENTIDVAGRTLDLIQSVKPILPPAATKLRRG
jgi:hypothetical protein